MIRANTKSYSTTLKTAFPHEEGYMDDKKNDKILKLVVIVMGVVMCIFSVVTMMN